MLEAPQLLCAGISPPATSYLHSHIFVTSINAMEEEDHNALIEKVTAGFGALLGQVQELAAKNDALEQKLSHVRGEVCSSPSYSKTLHRYYDENLSSRPEATM